MKPTRWIAEWPGLLLVLVLGVATALSAESAPSPQGLSAIEPVPQPGGGANTDGPVDLASRQRELATKFARLEQVLLRLAEVTAPQNPRRAALLREAISQSRDKEIPVHFETIVRLLQDDRLALASKDQGQIAQQLDALLQLLLKENRASRLESEKRRVRRYVKELNRLIQAQRGVKARTEGGDQTEPLADAQQTLAEKTSDLVEGIAKDEGVQGDPTAGQTGAPPKGKPDARQGQPKDKPDNARKPTDERGAKPDGKAPADGRADDGGNELSPSSQPGEDQPGKGKPGDGKPGEGQPDQGQPEQDSPPGSEQRKPNTIKSANERVRAAQRQMQRAHAKLQEAKRRGASQDQAAALDELQQAKAMLERILRQMREEEVEQILVRLEARFRRMLQVQLEIHEGTKRVDSVPVNERGHDDEIEAGRLSRSEALLVDEADKALLLLREDGSSVAFPEAVEQIREDMVDVADRLRQVKVGVLTQETEQEIIRALEEAIVAIRKLQKKMDKRRGQSGQPAPAGQMAEPPLVDAMAELRMIRALQLRVNRQTERYRKLFDGSQADPAELHSAVERLAVRQQRIHQATRDLSRQAKR